MNKQATMTDNSDAIRSRIRKLLALGADDGATDAEADAALRFARHLMQKHQVEEAEVSGEQDVHVLAAEAEYQQVQQALQGARLTSWESLLAHALTKLAGTVKWYVAGEQVINRKAGRVVLNPHTGQPATCATIRFYGPAVDVLETQQMFEEWSTTIFAMARLRWGGALRGAGRSYCEGFARAVYDKVLKMVGEEQQVIEEKSSAGDSLALVLQRSADLSLAKLERAAEWLKEQGVDLGKPSRRGGGGDFHGEAYNSGKEDGQKADLGRGARGQKRLGGG